MENFKADLSSIADSPVAAAVIILLAIALLGLAAVFNYRNNCEAAKNKKAERDAKRIEAWKASFQKKRADTQS